MGVVINIVIIQYVTYSSDMEVLLLESNPTLRDSSMVDVS